MPPTQFRPGTPRDLETICMKCLFKEQDRRYATADELANDLRRYLNGEPIQARPVSACERAVRWCQRNKTVAGLLATAFLLVLTLAIGAIGYALEMNAKNKVITDEKAKVVTQRDQYRGTVQKFVADAPAFLDQPQIGTGTKEEFLKFLADLLAEADTNVDDQGITRRGVQATLNTEGDLALSRRDFVLADQKYITSKAITVAQLLNPQGETDRLRGNLAMTIRKLATLEKMKPNGVPELVIDYYQQALKLQQAVLTTPETTNIPPDEARIWIGRTHTDLAEFLRMRRDFKTAREHSTQAIEVFKAITPANLSSWQQEQYQLGYAMAWLEDGRIAFKLGNDAGGHAGFTEAMKLYDAAAAKNPTSTRIRMLAADPPAEYGDLQLVRFNDVAQALALYDKSLSYLRPVAVTPETARLHRRLAYDFYRKAMAHLKMGDGPNAKLYFERAWGVLEGAFQGVNEEYERNQARLRAVKEPTEQARLRDEGSAIAAEQNTIRINLMVYRARTGRMDGAAGALDIADRIRAAYPKIGPKSTQYAQTQGWLIQAAITYGLCAALDSTKKAERLDKAFECLREAITRGFNDEEYLKSDPDLDSLRGDPRFKLCQLGLWLRQ